MTEPTRTIKIYEKTHPKLKILAATTGETMMDLIERLVTQQETHTMNNQPSTVTLKFVAQSGHVWEETIDTDEVDAIIESTIKTHIDIERVEKLADPNDMTGETVWRFE